MEYYNQDNWIKNMDDTSDGVANPEITYLSPPPDDLVHAESEGEYFFYTLTDSVTGDYLYDPDTNMFIEKGVGYSVEYNGEYYWTYSLYRVPVEGVNHDQSVENTWAPATSVEQFPATYELSWKVEIEELTRDVESGDLSIVLSEESQYPPLQINSFDEGTYEYTLGVQEADIDLSEYVFVTINGVKFGDGDDEYYYRDLDKLYYDEGDTIASSDDIFTVDNAKKTTHKFTIENEYINGEDVAIEIIFDPVQKRFESFDNTHYINYRNKQSVEFLLPTGDERNYDITFSDDLETKNVTVPTHWQEGEIVESTEFRFTKLFDNEYKYPDQATTDLLRLEFDNGELETFPLEGLNTYASIAYPGYPFDEFEVKSRLDGNDVILYVDQLMYYDYINETLESGTSNGSFEDFQGLILPWDSVGSGTIYLTLFTNTYDDYQFNFQLKIGSKNKLRGDNGKYELERRL